MRWLLVLFIGLGLMMAIGSLLALIRYDEEGAWYDAQYRRNAAFLARRERRGGH